MQGENAYNFMKIGGIQEVDVRCIKHLGFVMQKNVGENDGYMLKVLYKKNVLNNELFTCTPNVDNLCL